MIFRVYSSAAFDIGKLVYIYILNSSSPSFTQLRWQNSPSLNGGSVCGRSSGNKTFLFGTVVNILKGVNPK